MFDLHHAQSSRFNVMYCIVVTIRPVYRKFVLPSRKSIEIMINTNKMHCHCLFLRPDEFSSDEHDGDRSPASGLLEDQTRPSALHHCGATRCQHPRMVCTLSPLHIAPMVISPPPPQMLLPKYPKCFHSLMLPNLS